MLFYAVISLSVFSLILLTSLVFLVIKSSKYKTINNMQAIQLEKITNDLEKLNDENSQLISENSSLRTSNENIKQFAEDKYREIEKNKAEMENKFKSISNEILRSQTQYINENQVANLNNILQPFKEQLQVFKEEINKNNQENIKNKTSFDEQFKSLLSLNQSLSKDAQNLTDALRGSKKMQGDWGEIELSRILEVSGLQKDIDYYTQENFKTDENKNVRPDVIVRLPNERCVIVDSKVSLNDYVSYVNAENEVDKNLALQKHIQCIKAHIDELSCKEYQKLMKGNSLDYVVIFIPIESAFVEAIRKDADLYDYAYKKNIALTTPSSLLPILRTVENLWRIENQNKYVQKIAEVGGLLYDKLANFGDDMQKVDKALATARQNYDNALSKLSTGKGNALSLAQRLKDYGAKANKTISIEFEQAESEILAISDNREVIGE